MVDHPAILSLICAKTRKHVGQLGDRRSNFSAIFKKRICFCLRNSAVSFYERRTVKSLHRWLSLWNSVNFCGIFCATHVTGPRFCFQGKADGQRSVVWLRARLQDQLSQLGYFLQRHAGKVLFVAVLALAILCVALKSAQVNSKVEQLWVQGKRLSHSPFADAIFIPSLSLFNVNYDIVYWMLHAWKLRSAKNEIKIANAKQRNYSKLDEEIITRK